MNALVGRTAKANLAFSVGVFGMLAQDTTGQDRGDFGGAGAERELVRKFQERGWHGRMVLGCNGKMATIVTTNPRPHHPEISSSYGLLQAVAGFDATFSRAMDRRKRDPFL